MATECYGGNTIAQVLLGSTTTLALDDGSISGNAGCNSYYGSIGDMITSSFWLVGPLAVTNRYCMGQELNFQEELYLHNFCGGTVIEYNILGDDASFN